MSTKGRKLNGNSNKNCLSIVSLSSVFAAHQLGMKLPDQSLAYSKAQDVRAQIVTGYFTGGMPSLRIIDIEFATGLLSSSIFSPAGDLHHRNDPYFLCKITDNTTLMEFKFFSFDFKIKGLLNN